MGLYKRGSGKKWHYKFKIGGRQYRGATGQEDIKLARQVERRARAEAAGLVGPAPQAEEPLTPPDIAQFVAAYVDELARRGRSTKHQKQTGSYLERLFKAAGVAQADATTAADIERGLEAFGGGSSNRNYPLRAARSFFRWLVKTGRATTNPAELVDLVGQRSAKEQRRAMSSDEVRALLSCDAIPEARRLIYAVALTTGLRRGELGAVALARLDLDSGILELTEEDTKNARRATLTLCPELVERWRSWLENPVTITRGTTKAHRRGALREWSWERVDRHNGRALPPPPLVRTFYEDLARAGIERVTNQGRLDFHALRVTFCSALIAADVPLAMAQQLMRHSTPTLTANLYTRFQPADRRAAIDAVGVAFMGGAKGGTKSKNGRASK